jgi:hypothetical protein
MLRILDTLCIVEGLIHKVTVHFTYVAPSENGGILLQRCEPLKLKRAMGLWRHVLFMKRCYHIEHGDLVFLYYGYLRDHWLPL